MNTLYKWLDGFWGFVSHTIFVRFHFNIPSAEIKTLKDQGMITFVLTHGGILDWLILSSWCRSQNLGAILVCNRKRILLLSRPLFFFQILFKTRTYTDLFLGVEKGPRLIFCPKEERKKLFKPTKTEVFLSELYGGLKQHSRLTNFWFIPINILWRRYLPGERRLGNFLVGLYTNPNWLGKFWFLLRKRDDSTVQSFPPMTLTGAEEGEENAKIFRRKIFVMINQEMRVVLGPRYSSPDSVKEILMNDPDIQQLSKKIAIEEGVDKKKIFDRVYKIFTEIASNYRYRTIEICYAFLTWFLNKVLDGINFKDDELKKVREVMKNKPVVFVSAHRSHLDYLLVPYVLFLHDIVTPHIAAGINMDFWPFGRFFRSGGGFFIRRSFKGDELYSLCLRKYIQFLIKNRYPLKFFIEGTRSRSGKMLSPAYGLLKMSLETFKNKIVEDIAYIPVSICYDEVLEQSSYSKELSGSQKKQESAGELIKSRKVIYKNIGKVYLRFADAISIKEVAEENKDLSDTLFLQKAAFQICKKINDVTPITPKTILSTILLCHPSPIISEEDLASTSKNLDKYITWASAPKAYQTEASLELSIEKILPRLIKTGLVNRMESSLPRGFYCETRKRAILNFYKNNAVHIFVLPAITLISFFDCLKYFTTEDFFRQYCKTALRLRNLLKFEFFFSPTQVFLTEIEKNFEYFFGEKTWGNAPTQGWLERLTEKFSVADISILLRSIGELIESEKVVFNFSKENISSVLDKKTLLQKILKFAEQGFAENGILFPESISIQNYTNSLQLLENLKVIKIQKDKEKVTYHFEKWNAELDSWMLDIQRWLEILDTPVEEHLEKVGFTISPQKPVFSEPTSLL